MKSLSKLCTRKLRREAQPATIDDVSVVKKPQQQRHATTEGSVIARVLGGGSFDGSTISALLHLKTRNSASTMAISALSSSGSSQAAQKFLRHSSSFLRVADLDLSAAETAPPSPGTSSFDETLSVESGHSTSICGSSNSEAAANFRYAAVNPPPGVDPDPSERWVALDDGSGSHAPIAPLAVQALVKAGLTATLDESMWTQHSASRYFKAAPWHTFTWPCPGEDAVIPNKELPSPGAKFEDTVLLWIGRFRHGLYGSDLPAIRAVGIIPAAPEVLFDLLIDSERVKEYNKLSLGREDLIVLQNSLDQEGPFGRSVTKVMRSKSRPPLIPQVMQFVSMLHAQELDDKSGYLIVTRAVTHPDDRDRSDTSVLRSEILLGVNIIRRIEGDSERCVVVNMIHMRSPMVPMVIANRIGASAAASFIHDLRAAFVFERK